MRLLQVSDLHLEFDPSFRIFNDCDANILVLGGDTYVVDYFTRDNPSPYYHMTEDVRFFFDIVSKEFEYVIMILGNHEHYLGVFDENIQILRDNLSMYSNIHILNNEYIDIDGVRFLGGTLWTNVGNRNPIGLNHLSGYLNDFRLIKKSKKPFRKFLPLDSAIEFDKAVDFISSNLTDNSVVLTHHLPSERSVHSIFKKDTYGNMGYYSNLDEFILDHPEIKLWTHGHTHFSFDYMIGSTRIVSNPRGYRGENSDFCNKVIEL